MNGICQQAADHFLDAGLSVIPCGPNKRSACGPWKGYQEQPPTQAETERWFGKEQHTGLAVIGGEVSCGLEIIDFDYPELYPEWCELVSNHNPDLLEDLPTVQTPSGGFHVYYRAGEVQGNQKLARDLIPVDGPGVHEHEGKEYTAREMDGDWYITPIMIETRGEGGYALAPPSPGYRMLSGKLTDIPSITDSERELLLGGARSFNLYAPKDIAGKSQPSNRTQAGERPGDAFNSNGGWQTCRTLLEQAGWKLLRTRSGGVEEWRRPGKREHALSATYNHIPGRFYVFSTNAVPFEAERTYQPFSVYAILEHGADFSAAAQALAQKGYGNAGSDGAEPRPEASAEDLGFNLSDYGNAERLVHYHGKDLRYCKAWNEWLAWTETHWQRDDSGEVMRRAKWTVRHIREVAAHVKDKARREALWKWARRSEHHARLCAMIKTAWSELPMPVKPDELDADDWLLNVENGTLDLRTGTLLPHDRRDLITQLAPVEYDAGAECPRWKRFLWEIFDSDEDLIQYVQRAAGYTLTGSTAEQCIFIPYGTGANGKGTFINTMAYVMGDYAQATRPELVLRRKRTGGASEGEAALRGARFVETSETGSGNKFDEATVKRLTGSDTIRARFLHANEFEFRPTHKLWLATNHKPVIEDTDYAIWRRIQLIPFRVTFGKDEQDTELEEKLRAEAAGILNWLVEGCLAWKSEGLGLAKAVRRATAQYRSEMDVLGGFLEECCVMDMPEMSVHSSRLYKEYEAWCQRAGEKAEPRRKFGLLLTERGFTRAKRRDGIWYENVGLRSNRNENVENDPS